ncbi:CU044_2847 family protein [Streptomyces brasiliensis]|uniref:Trypsin-co-occurring domain-containing protein n=1 Tax=Streptomyces brasiliensis TaxID=1954 RepID=A0A917KIP1_9ACTN|nr:hypothetical protein GCM10010121_022190 [Streptomyces brasiliensis]
MVREVTRVARVELPDGTSVWARISGAEELAVPSGELSYTDTGFAERVEGSVESLHSLVTGVARSLAGPLRAVRPDEVSVEFGIELTAKAGKVVGLLADGEAKAAITVTLTWNGGGPPDPTTPDAQDPVPGSNAPEGSTGDAPARPSPGTGTPAPQAPPPGVPVPRASATRGSASREPLQGAPVPQTPLRRPPSPQASGSRVPAPHDPPRGAPLPPGSAPQAPAPQPLGGSAPTPHGQPEPATQVTAHPRFPVPPRSTSALPAPTHANHPHTGAFTGALLHGGARASVGGGGA